MSRTPYGDCVNVYGVPKGDIPSLLENKRDLESKAELILAGCIGLSPGKEPKEFRPDVPEHLKGALLRGMTAYDFYQRRETKEDAKRKHEKAVLMGYLDPRVKVRYNDDGSYTVIHAANQD